LPYFKNFEAPGKFHQSITLVENSLFYMFFQSNPFVENSQDGEFVENKVMISENYENFAETENSDHKKLDC
jgi:hypothetical protein